MAQSFWLVQRALAFQNECLVDLEISPDAQTKELALYLRYQTAHQCAFHRCLNDLLKLRAEKRKAEIGFEESQRQKQGIVVLRESAENRKQDRHKLDILLAEAKVDHQMILNSNLEFDRKVAAATQNRLPEAVQAA